MIVRDIISARALLEVKETLRLIEINARKFERSGDYIISKSLDEELSELYQELYDFSLVLIDELEYFLELEKDKEEEEIILNEEEDF